MPTYLPAERPANPSLAVEWDAAHRAAIMTEARRAAQAAGVVTARLDTFVHLIDTTGDPDDAAIAQRVRSTLAEMPEFGTRFRRQSVPGPDQSPTVDSGTLLAQMSDAAGLPGPAALTGSTAPAVSTTVLEQQTADVLAATKSEPGLR